MMKQKVYKVYFIAILMVNPNLYVVGTCHIDPDGESRLTYILERLMPNIVAVEMSKDRDG